MGTKPKSAEQKSKKRRFGAQQDGPDKKKRKLNHETDLTKSKNIILCSCQKFKEKTCGRQLKLVFSEYIEEFLKANSKKNDDAKDENKNIEDEGKKDDDLTVNQTNNDKKENEVKNDENDGDKKKEEKEDNTNNAVSISAAIDNELSHLKEERVCEWVQGPDGLVVIDILNEKVKPSELLEFVFNRFHPKRPTLSPFVYKLFPLDRTTFSRQKDMIELAEKMISEEKWDKIPKDHSYAINYKNRGNKKLDRSTIIKEIASFVPNEYKVNLNNPNTVLLLQTFGRTAGLSIIKNSAFKKHKEYNLGNFEE